MFDKYPPKGSEQRLDNYAYFQELFLSQHYEAFGLSRGDDFTDQDSRMKYVVFNFGGMVSRLLADLLFGEPVTVRVEDPKTQEWIDAFIHDSEFNSKNYESAMSNSFLGDAVYKLRIDSSTGEPKIILDDTSPSVYFPIIDPINPSQNPKIEVIGYPVQIGGQKYLFTETHVPSLIINELWEMADDGRIRGQVDLSIYDEDLPEFVETRVDKNLIVHIPNWKYGRRHFGISDYIDIDRLIYAMNKRMTKIDEILDKHSQPIVALPEGVLDKKGKVKPESLDVYEVPTDVQNPIKPEYIVWNASLDNAFSQIDHLMDWAYMVSETSPDAYGFAKGGKAESGRALKFRLLSTIRKRNRKKIYYNRGIREVIYLAQMLAEAWGIEVGGVKPPSTPELPSLEWEDGIVNDTMEMALEEQVRLESGTQDAISAIMRLDGVDEQTAIDKYQKILKERGGDINAVLEQLMTGKSNKDGKTQ